MARGGAREGAGRRPGVPNKATADVKAAAAEYSERALKTLSDIMVDAKAPAAARVAAAGQILDRAHGKPKQSVDIDADMVGALTVTYITKPGSPASRPSEEDYETPG